MCVRRRVIPLRRHPCADDVPKRFTPDKHVEFISCCETVGIEFVLVLEYTVRQRAGGSRIQPARLIRHDVNPVGLHAFAPDCTRLESSGADSSASHELCEEFSSNDVQLSERQAVVWTL